MRRYLCILSTIATALVTFGAAGTKTIPSKGVSMRKQNLLLALATLLWTIFGISQPLVADVTGTFLGTVTDPSGAVIPGAGVSLRNPNTGLVRTATTDTTGSYRFLEVPVGDDYILEVSASGFQKAVQSGIKLLVNQAFRADFQLQVGGTTQTVEVSAAPVQVEATNTQLGDVIEDRKLNALPLNGRSYIDLLGLQSGVVPISSSASVHNHSVSGNGYDGVLSVNGNRESANAFLVNGGDVEEGTDNGASIVPTLDSIQEFRLLTSSFDAEYGRFSGGIVNVVTKGGTNAFHGTIYEFLRNEKLDSRNFFDLNKTDPATGQELPGTGRGAFKRNQFGGAVGGRIIRDRLFFFSDYQGTREVRGASSGVIPVPSLAERGGDFSDVGVTGFPELTGDVRGCDTAGGHCMNDVLSQRLGYTVTNGEPYWVPGCDTLAQAQAGMCVFPGQVIPQSAWSSAAKGTLQFIREPTGERGGSPFFSTTSYKGVVRDDKFANRIDLNTKRTGNWAFYHHFDDANVLNPYAGGNMPGFASVSPTRAQQINLSNTRNFGATAVNDWRLNFTRFAMRLGQPKGGLGKVSEFGFVEGGLGLIPTVPELEGVPRVSLDSTGISFGVPSSPWQFNNTFQVLDNFSKIVGRHTIKLGADFRDFQINMRWRYGQNGTYDFYGAETGNDFADYLLGAPDLFILASPGYLDARSKYGGLYAQDSFKFRPNLTLNYGLRWEFSQPWSDKYNRLQAFVPGLQSKRYPDSPLGWVFDRDPGIPSTLGPTRYNNFAPRLGIAYSPGFSDGILGGLFGGPGKTSIRAAFGMYYTAFEQIQNNYELGNPPFAVYYLTPVPDYLEEPFKGRRGSDPGQRFPFVSYPDGTTGIWAQFQPIASVPGFVIDNKLPYTEHFNFTIQREFSGSTVLTLGYVGTAGHHLLAQREANPGDPARCLQVRQILGPDLGCGPFGEDTIYDLGNGQKVYGTRPYSVTSGRLLSQGILDIGEVEWMETWGNSIYNAFQVSIDRRVGALRLLGAYTWSKAMDDSSGFADLEHDPYNRSLERALSAFDMTHNFVTSYSYDLPFQKLASSPGGALRKFLDGWQVSGITRFSRGIPILLYDSRDLSLCGCGGADYPNYNGQPIQFFDPRDSAKHQFFSTSQFSKPDLGVPGTANRRFFHGPGLNNWDFALHKTTRITERTSIEFRAEFFNMYNHAQFLNPRGNLASSRFGRVTKSKDPRIGQLALKVYF